MNVPGWLLRHEVIIEPYAGDSAYGATYGPGVTVAALVSETVKTVRDQRRQGSSQGGGPETVSTAQFIAPPDIDCPAGSRVTLPTGRITWAVNVARHTAPGLPVPQSTEVMCE